LYFFDQFIDGLLYLLSPNKRIYWAYLLSGVVMMLAWLLLHKKSIQGSLRQSFSKQYWWNASTKLDLKWFCFNQIVFSTLLVTVIGGQFAFAISTYKLLAATFGAGDFWQLSPLTVTLIFTITLFVIDDFSRFIVHFLYHKVPFLWRFHAIHHSAKVMTPLTLYRIHFVEYCINSARSILVTGFISGVFLYCFDGRINTYDIIGVSILNMMFNALGANLRHSHIPIHFGKFEHLFISPAQHQLHHSSKQQDLDINFGSSLAIWDKLFRSWRAGNINTSPRFGLYKTANPQRFLRQITGIK